MARIKVGDLELTERGWPLLVRASYETYLLHISTHSGVWVKPSKLKYVSNRFFTVTKCSKPFRWPIHFEMGFSGLTDFQLCSRCGTPEDFKAAMKAHEVVLAAQQLERQENEAERQAERQRDAEVKAQLACEIASFLSHLNAFEVWAKSGKVFIRYEGVLYRLPVMKEKE